MVSQQSMSEQEAHPFRPPPVNNFLADIDCAYSVSVNPAVCMLSPPPPSLPLLSGAAPASTSSSARSTLPSPSSVATCSASRGFSSRRVANHELLLVFVLEEEDEPSRNCSYAETTPVPLPLSLAEESVSNSTLTTASLCRRMRLISCSTAPTLSARRHSPSQAISLCRPAPATACTASRPSCSLASSPRRSARTPHHCHAKNTNTSSTVPHATQKARWLVRGGHDGSGPSPALANKVFRAVTTGPGKGAASGTAGLAVERLRERASVFFPASEERFWKEGK